MTRWARSGLRKGDRVRIPEDMLVSGSPKRFIKAEYEGETSQGIMLRLYFEAGIMTEDSEWSYRTFISLASIHCGNIKLKDVLGHDIKAKMINGRRCMV